MRSSVSAILSDPAPDSSMAFPDYQQSCTDHARLLVLITRIGHQISDETYKTVSDCINQVRDVPIRDKTGLNRIIRVRYAPLYHVENNDWAEFQAHRRLVGVISVGSCASQVELNELCRLHESAKQKFTATLFDSRCVVLCEGAENGIGEEDMNGSDTSANGSEKIEQFKDQQNVEDSLDKPPSWFQPQNHKTRLLQFHGSKYAAGLRTDIQEFIASLFWVLESKRVDLSREGGDKAVLLCAPFERKDFVGLDMESRNNRKRILGRQKKHLGDLSLLAGLPADSWNYYQAGMEILRPANDWLWLAGCQEGVCAVSMILQESQQHGNSLGSVGLTQDEIIEKYRDCVNHYAKYKNAGIIETEASLKAVKYLVINRSFLLASEFLQNIVFINLQLSDREKIERFISLSDLYSKIGFQRKAAFFQRVAAMRCVAPGNPQHDWGACYSLMLKAVQGYDLDLCASIPPDKGWPTLQVQLLQELVGTSRKMGAHSASTRHMTYLFENLFRHLSGGERQDFATQLSVLSQRAPTNSAPLQLDNLVNSSKLNFACDINLPIILPAINITSTPRVTSMTALPLAGHLTPVSAPTSQSVSSGPFLFTPIQNFGGGSARSSGRAKPKKIVWVEGRAGEVCLEVKNSLGVEVKVTSLALVSTGAHLDTEPATLILDSHPNTQTLILKAIPRSIGSLEIIGYTHSVLGVTSTCLLTDLPGFEDTIKIEIIPDLPLIEISLEQLELPDDINSGEGYVIDKGTSDDGVTNSSDQHTGHNQGEACSEGADPLGHNINNKQNCDNKVWRPVDNLSLFGGERRELRLCVRNIGCIAATSIELTCQVLDGEGPDIDFDASKIDCYVPLLPGQTQYLPLNIIGINNQNMRLDDGLSTVGSESRWSASASGSGYPSLQSRTSHTHSLPPNSSLLPSNLPASNHPTASNGHPAAGSGGDAGGGGGGPLSLVSNLSGDSGTDCLTATIRIRAGVKAESSNKWCRWCNTSVTVNQLPSIGVSRWDVLAGDTVDNCFLVLDLVNRTQYEVELTYSERKQLLIEPSDTCRVPVPVAKCGFSESLDWGEGGQEIINYINTRVNITWNFTEGSTRYGEVSLVGVYWSECMMDILRKPPLSSKILINSRECREGDQIEGRVGDIVSLQVHLDNCLLEPVEDCRLLVKLDQHSSGVSCCAGSTGSAGLHIPGQLLPGAQVEHDHHFVPLTPGQYSILVSISLRFRCRIYSWQLPNFNLDIVL